MNKRISHIIVFLTGIVTLSLQIIGARILAPHVGLTIATWTSMITIILIAIAGGYWYGGRLADRLQNPKLLTILLLLSALFVLSIIPLRTLMTHVPVSGSYELWSLLFAGLLFLLPGFLLGCITTYTIRLTITSIETLGKIVGTLYATNTAGNIIGIFLTSNILIAYFSIQTIIFLLSGTLGIALVFSFITTSAHLQKSL